MLLASLVLSIVSWSALAYAIEQRQLLLLAVACLIGGLGEANIAIAQSAVADVATSDQRGRLFAYTYTASSCADTSAVRFLVAWRSPALDSACRSGQSSPC